jgi:hypothetical protein
VIEQNVCELVEAGVVHGKILAGLEA